MLTLMFRAEAAPPEYPVYFRDPRSSALVQSPSLARPSGRATWDQEVTKDRLNQADRVISGIRAAADKDIPEENLEHANCVARVPHRLKGGFVAGAENGPGVAARRTDPGSSAPAFFAIAGGS